MNSLTVSIGKIRKWAASPKTSESYRTKNTYFTRGTAKLTFEKLAAFILGNNRNSAQIALNDFFRALEEEPVAKQTLFEARDKLSYEAFSDLSDVVVTDYYDNCEGKTYKTYTLLGVDGSLFQAPQGALETFGGQKSARCDSVSAQARALVVSDVLERIIVKASLGPVDEGERKMFLEILPHLRNFERPLFIFDRGFYSKELVKAMNGQGVFFLFRVKKSRCQKEIDAAGAVDQVISAGDCTLRVLNVALPNGEAEKLVTNITDESLCISDFVYLYEKRWGIETSYLMAKERLAIENFTSSKKNLMLQDFYAAVITYNLMEIASMEQEEKRQAKDSEATRKYKQSANRNIVAHEVRLCLLSVLLETDPYIIACKMSHIERIIYRFFKDVRPGRVYPRKVIFPNKKFPMNKKRNL